ncbi:MAG TPA: metallophosphoesterase family protein [Aggregatilineales bacterium]|nr:metallophosphoesterase family protein [Aggregatilineales bacterium]
MRVLIISDIHANLAALEAVLADANGQWDYVWCLGDVVGYGPDPNECVALLRTLPHLCLAGNHDWAALGRLDIRTFNADARKAVHWTQETLTQESIAYLDALPTTFVIGPYTLAHGSPREPVWEYILDPLIAALNFPHFETPYCLVGHTHTPIMFKLVSDRGDTDAVQPVYRSAQQLNGRRTIINPGSVGQPRDSNPEAAYAILEPEKMIWEHRRIAYPISVTQTKMRQIEMPERLIARLEHGW